MNQNSNTQTYYNSNNIEFYKGHIRQLEQQNAELLKALRTLVNNLPECQIEWARSAWGNTNTACVLEALLWARSVLEKIEEGKL